LEKNKAILNIRRNMVREHGDETSGKEYRLFIRNGGM
jgi:hypothetical protein